MGIPQGSVLSGLLCNFFFGYIEKRLLGDILDSTPPSAPPSPSTSSITRDVTPIGPSTDNRGNGSNNDDGMRPGCEGDVETSPAHLSDRFRCPAWEVGGGSGSGVGARARAAASAESDLARPLLGKPCGTAETINGVSHGEGGGYCARTCQSQRGHHSCETAGSSGGCGRDRTREDDRGGASVEEGRPFPHPEGDCTLLRQVDDFLLVTTSKAKATAFVSAMHDKVKTEEWGFSVHEAKVSLLVCLAWSMSSDVLNGRSGTGTHAPALPSRADYSCDARY